jgi:hypothetical protein
MRKLVIVLALLLVATPASADQIVAGGFGRASMLQITVALGYQLIGDDFHLGGFTDTLLPGVPLNLPCRTNCLGEVNLGSAWSGLHGSFGNAIWEGVTYERIWNTGTLQFFAAGFLDPLGPNSVVLQVPFTFVGHLSGYLTNTFQPPPGGPILLFTDDFFGEGTLTITYNRANPMMGYFVGGASYDFGEVIPEPATLLLLGSGIGFLASRRRHRQP